jgi:hypothetical protein
LRPLLLSPSVALVLALAAALAVVGVGCNEEPLDLDPRRDGGGGGGGSGAGGGGGDLDAGPGGGAGGGGPGVTRDARVDESGVPIEPMPDREAFETEILAILDRRCSSLACHAGPPPRDDSAFQMYGSPDNPVFRLTDEQIDANYVEFLAFVDFWNPDQSDILRYPLAGPDGDPPHPTNSGPVFTSASADYLTLRDWIVAATTPPEPDAGIDMGVPSGDGGMGGSGGGVPCEALPSTDAPGRPAGWMMRFVDEVHPMLVASCSESECHGTPGFGGSLWLQTDDDECGARWNYLAVQWFIDPITPVASPLLTQPVAPQHGGREVFAGTADPRYGLLRRWIEEGL